jgi:hypothetical protein
MCLVSKYPTSSGEKKIRKKMPNDEDAEDEDRDAVAQTKIKC